MPTAASPAPPSRGQVLILLLILVGLATVEWLAGRPPVSTSGTVRPWTGDAYGPENSQMLADWYSLSHVVHGLLLYGASWLVARRWPVGWRLVAALLIEAAWEIVENMPVVIERYRSTTAALGYSGDTILNSLGDAAFMLLGFALARLLPVGGSVAFGLALEAISLVAIRDNLALNVLMLLHPIEAIRAWQTG